MKKLKFMLLSFALLAVVGGALAFKAKFLFAYCYTVTNGLAAPNNVCTDIASGQMLSCPNLGFSTTVQATGVFCTTRDNDAVLDCLRNGGDDLLCNTTTRLRVD